MNRKTLTERMKKAIGALLVAIAVAGPLSAQVIDDVEVLDWDRPRRGP